MDPFAALGVAAAVIQFIDFGSKVGKWMLLMYDKSSIDPHEYFERTTADLDDYLKILEERQSLWPSPDAELKSGNEEAIEQLIIDCRSVAQSLRDTFRKITHVSLKTNRVAATATRGAIIPVLLQSFKAVWKESEIEAMASLLETYRSQLILRTLLSLDIKADAALSQQGDIDKNLSGIIEVLAVLQERQKTSTAAQTQRLVDRLDESDHLARRCHEETITAILKFKDGNTQVLEPRNGQGIAALVVQESTRQRLVKLNAAPMSSLAKASVDDLGPVEGLVLNSLYFRQITDRMETVKSPHEKTYEWVFCDPLVTGKPWDDFTKWLSHGSGCYWICGKAGAGKSTLMKYIFQDPRTSSALREWAQGKHLVQTAFFFWGLGNAVQKSQEGLLRSLLYDILRREPQLIWVVMTELLPIATNLGPGEKLAKPSKVELMRWFKRLLQPSHGRRYFFLIDGLDEYEGDTSTLVDLISSLSYQENVKFVLSSRPIPVCVENFSSLPKLYLHDLTRDDIRRYAEDWLSDRVRRKGNDASVLVEKIVEKSFGVFIWVELIVKSLIRGLENRDNMVELERRLDELPSDLAALYAHMLTGMSPMYRKQAAHIFRTALQAMQTPACPLLTLQMSYAEEDPTHLLSALVEPISKEEELSRCDEIDGRIRSRCCGLIETRRPTPSETKLCAPLRFGFPCVDFLHRTVVEFLADSEVSRDVLALSGPSFDPLATLFHTASHMCKLLPRSKSVDGDTSLVWHLMRDSLTYAGLAEEAQSPVPAVYLRNLDNTMAEHWHTAKKMTNSHMSRKAVDHWAASLPLLRSNGNTEAKILGLFLSPWDFTSLAIAFNLSSFLIDEISSPSTLLAKSTDAKSRALYNATKYLIQWSWPKSESHRLRELSTLSICEHLLKNGADPNAVYEAPGSGSGTGSDSFSTWSMLVRAVIDHKKDSAIFRRDFEQNGFARTLAKIVASFVVYGADVNARVWWREKRYCNDDTPVVFHRSPLLLLDGVFAAPSRPDFSASLLSQLGPEEEELDGASQDCDNGLLEKFHQGLVQLLLDRGAVAQEWRSGQLVGGQTEKGRKSDAGSPSTSDKLGALGVSDGKTRVRFRHKLKTMFGKDI